MKKIAQQILDAARNTRDEYAEGGIEVPLSEIVDTELEALADTVRDLLEKEGGE